MQHKTAVRVAVATGVALCAVAFFALRPPPIVDVSQPHGIGESIVAIPRNDVGVQQTWRATNDHIQGVGVIVAKADLETGTVTAEVLPGPSNGESAESLRAAKATIEIDSISDWQNVWFEFPKTKVTPGAEYVLKVTSPDGAFMGGGRNDFYKQGAATVDGQPVPKDMIFRVYRHFEPSDMARPVSGGVPAWLVALLSVAGAFLVGFAGILLLDVGGNGRAFEGTASTEESNAA